MSFENLSSPLLSNIPLPNSSSRPPLHLKLGTLNCRSIAKTANPSIRSSFIRHLRTHSFDILALQETHTDNILLQQTLHNQFQAHNSIWSAHCGLICFHLDIVFTNSYISRCGRLINTSVSHRSHLFDPFTLTVVYFPASSGERSTFLSSDVMETFFPTTPSRQIILGDFNYSYANHFPSMPRRAPQTWLEYIDRFFINAITPAGQVALSTFQNHRGTSCTDYGFATKDMHSTIHYNRNQVNFLPIEWTDHRLLSLHLCLHSPSSHSSSATSIGSGFWKAHPRLARDVTFQDKLFVHLSETANSFPSYLPASLKWEQLKQVTAKTARAYSRRQAFTLSRAEALLQRKRSKIESNLLRNPSLQPELSPQLQVVQEQLSSLQQYHVETLALKAGIRWREKGELSAGYLKHTASSRLSKSTIPPLQHPSLNRVCHTKEEMLNSAFLFYDKLYSPDPIDLDAVQSLLDSIPSTACISASESNLLLERITFDELIEAFSRCPSKSSPGLDGLPYAIVKLIVTHPSCREIALQVFNDALL